MPQYNESPPAQLILIGEDDLDDQDFLKDIFATFDNNTTLHFVSNGVEL